MPLFVAAVCALWTLPSDAQQMELAPRSAFAGGESFRLFLCRIDSARWCYPLKQGRVISRYGQRGSRPHHGTDIKTFPRDTIRAAFDGYVRQSATIGAYGKCVIMTHDLGIETLYSHNTQNLVRRDTFVRAGTPIALAGRTGRATTEHLHFEIRVDNRPVDTGIFFNHDSHKLRRRILTFHKSGRVEIEEVGEIAKK